MKTIVSATFIVGIFLAITSTARASICVAPGVPGALDRAEAVFVGKIVNVAAARDDNGALSTTDYVVRFEIQESWKGTEAREMNVLWRSQIEGCSYYPVGQIGETFLVYADPSSSGPAHKGRPEITIFNRTSLLPPKSGTVTLSQPVSGRETSLYLAPELNKRDAANDLQLLRLLKNCGCQPQTLSSCLGLSSTSWQSTSDAGSSSATTSGCCNCLRRGKSPQ
ncbi:MAG TPA: hypothetical protein VJT15_03580 [Pyrinomonadaceae bacterium]|nr:hypothetical protein [Pyrinomonadaceae bacterium]